MKQINKKVLLITVIFISVLVGTAVMLVSALQRKGEQEGQNVLLARLEQNAETCGQEGVAEAASLERSGLDYATRFLTTSMELADVIPDKDKAGRRKNTMFLANDETAGADTEMTQKSEVPETVEEPIPEAGSEIGILTIPKIGARLPVTAGVTEEQLKISEGWVMQTAPIGSAGNAVVAGHRSYTWGRHFNRLDELEAGDEIIYTKKGGETMRFVVYETLTVEPDDPAVFAAPPAGRAQLTLYTCTPVRIATHRLVVRALLEE